MRRRDLADGVPGHQVRHDTERLDQPEQRHLDREQPRLGEHRLVQQLRLGHTHPGEQHLPQRTRQQRIQVSTHLVQGRGEHRERPVQLTTHTGALRALAGEEDGGAAAAGDSPYDGGRGLVVGQRTEGGEQSGAVGGQQHGAVLEGAAGGGERPAHVGDGQVRLAVDEGPQPARLLVQGCGVAGRQDAGDEVTRDARGGGGLRRGGLGGLLDDGVRVGAADAERRHRRAAGPVDGGPRPGLGEQRDRPGRPVDVRGRLLGVQGRRQHAVPHRQHHLDHTGDAGRRLGVADVRLDRPQPQWTVLRSALPVRGQQRLRLDRVAEGGAGAVRLDGVDVGGGEPGVGERLPDHPLLGGAVRRGQAAAGAVLVDGAAPDDGEHAVAVALRVGEALQQEHADALGEAGAVGACAERLAPPVGRQAALPGELGEHAGGGHDAHPAGEGEAALVLPQRLGGQVQRHQRRRAGGVDGDGRALQAEQVRDAAGGDAAGAAVADVAVQVVGAAGGLGGVVVVDEPDVDAGAAAPRRVGVDPGPLECLPGGLQQQPLLWVHGQGLAGGDPEEGGVELGGVVEEAALPRYGVRVLAAGAQVVEVPAPVGGEGRDDVGAGGDHVPQLLGGLHVAGEPAGHADDGDRFVEGGGGADRGGPVHDCRAAELPVQELGEHHRGRVVERHGGGQPQAGGGGEPVAQFHRGERVEAQFLEGALGVDGLRRAVPEHCRHAGGHQVEQVRAPLRRAERRQPVAYGGGGGEAAAHRAPVRASRADHVAQQAGHVLAGRPRRGRQVHEDEVRRAALSRQLVQRHAFAAA